MKRLCLLAVFVLGTFLSQASPVDSLQKALKFAPNDSVRLLLLDELTHQASQFNPHLSLEYAHQTIHLAEKLNHRKIKRQGLHALGLNHYRLGNYDKTLDYFRQVLRMFEEDGDQKGIARLHNNIGILYDELNQHEKALSYYYKALEVKRTIGDSTDVASTLCNIGFAYQNMGLPDKAHAHLMQALQIDLDADNKEGLIYTYQNLGKLYASLNKNDSALYYYQSSLALLDEHGSEYEQSEVLLSIGNIHLKRNLPRQARQAYEQALSHAIAIRARKVVKDCYHGLAMAYQKEENWRQSLHYFQEFENLKDSIFNEENIQKISEIESSYLVQRREKEIELLRKDARIQELNLSRNQMISYYLYSGLFLLFLMILFLYQQYKSKNSSNTLLKQHNKEIASRNTEITDSIRYAKTIQEALLPQEANLLHVFPKSFLYCEARDILNGDFFWIHEQNDLVVWAVVDCTGHGVPGALMTILANNLLNQIVKERGIMEPAHILAELNRSLQHNLQKDLKEDLPHSMDLGICLYGRNSGQLLFAGSRRSLYTLEGGELKIYQTPNPMIGSPSEYEMGFRQLTLHPAPGSCLYLFTDGITDQFGGPNNKKFLHNRLQEVLRTMCGKGAYQQKEEIARALADWRQQEEQTDDMLLMGICLPEA
ncbi:tetratricopeptide repeat protein [Cesiribacter andamanensis]|uniref:Phosphoserine phosphatase rsbU n=1 Tax=Cesiribacter andamanensis AMV16 TaxID=1279009 RepID=M7NC56_9BACT|nr:tetratricopeptide repeat protein [Cesiribacter andamanensis]EMR04817.1 Phosphoserine phosphatase rsbU [Cesiribacter andamanensis AMV16]